MKPTIKDYQRKYVTEKLALIEMQDEQLRSVLYPLSVAFHRIKEQIKTVKKQMNRERNRLNKLKP